MKASRKTVEASILFFAKQFGTEQSYKAVLEYTGITRTLEMIIYDMFLNKFNPYSCTDEQYEHYKIILEFVTELKQNGMVIHE